MYCLQSNTIKLINSWVSQKTDNKITNFFAPGTLSGDTQTILIDILNLSGKSRFKLN